MISTRKAASALDLGCGGGRWTAALAELYGAVTAVDYSGLRLAAARARVREPNVTWVQKEVREHRPERLHDLVLAGFLLSHLTGTERKAMLGRLGRALSSLAHG